jgi:hypothetical protein
LGPPWIPLCPEMREIRDMNWMGFSEGNHATLERNFTCQTLKISKVSLVVMGHDDTPCGQPAPGRFIGRPGFDRPEGVIGVFSYTMPYKRPTFDRKE